MKLLGLSFGRKMENTEILVKEAMMGAEEAGSDVGFIRVLDLDIKAFFDSIDHGLMLKALRLHTQDRWLLLYIQRWLEAPVQFRMVGKKNGQLALLKEESSVPYLPICFCIMPLTDGCASITQMSNLNDTQMM